MQEFKSAPKNHRGKTAISKANQNQKTRIQTKTGKNTADNTQLNVINHKILSVYLTKKH